MAVATPLPSARSPGRDPMRRRPAMSALVTSRTRGSGTGSASAPVAPAHRPAARTAGAKRRVRTPAMPNRNLSARRPSSYRCALLAAERSVGFFRTPGAAAVAIQVAASIPTRKPAPCGARADAAEPRAGKGLGDIGVSGLANGSVYTLRRAARIVLRAPGGRAVRPRVLSHHQGDRPLRAGALVAARGDVRLGGGGRDPHG